MSINLVQDHLPDMTAGGMIVRQNQSHSLSPNRYNSYYRRGSGSREHYRGNNPFNGRSYNHSRSRSHSPFRIYSDNGNWQTIAREAMVTEMGTVTMADKTIIEMTRVTMIKAEMTTVDMIKEERL